MSLACKTTHSKRTSRTRAWQRKAKARVQMSGRHEMDNSIPPRVVAPTPGQSRHPVEKAGRSASEERTRTKDAAKIPPVWAEGVGTREGDVTALPADALKSWRWTVATTMG